MIKQLLNSVIAEYLDLSCSHRSIDLQDKWHITIFCTTSSKKLSNIATRNTNLTSSFLKMVLVVVDNRCSGDMLYSLSDASWGAFMESKWGSPCCIHRLDILLSQCSFRPSKNLQGYKKGNRNYLGDLAKSWSREPLIDNLAIRSYAACFSKPPYKWYFLFQQWSSLRDRLRTLVIQFSSMTYFSSCKRLSWQITLTIISSDAAVLGNVLNKELAIVCDWLRNW